MQRLSILSPRSEDNGRWFRVYGTESRFRRPTLSSAKRVAKGNEVVVTIGPKQLVKATFAIDPTQEPKAID